jgi:cell wall-associated NlpC family hydrolase
MTSSVARWCGTIGALAAIFWMIGTRRSAIDEPPREIRIDSRMLRPGDVVLRRGRDAVSEIVLAADGGSRFSHAGLVVQIGGVLGIAHILPAEAGHPRGAALTESMESFSSPDQAAEIAVFRLRQEPSGIPAEAARNALRYVKEKRRFDDRFSLATTTDLYCSELVWRAFLEAGIDLVDGHFQSLSLPISAGDFVLPSALKDSPHLKMILDYQGEE